MAAIWFIVGFWFLRERFEPLDLVYLLTQTLTTVGYGDLSGPADTGEGYLFFAFYALLSTLLIGQIFGVLVGRVRMEEEPPKSAEPPADADAGSPWQCLQRLDGRMAKFLKALFVWVMFVITWALFFSYYPGEEKELREGIYMAVITLTTIGFGDSVPETDGGKIFAILWMLAGTYAFTDLMGKFAIWSYFFFHSMGVEKLDKETLAMMVDSSHFQRVASARANEIRNLLEHPAEEHLPSDFAKKISRNDFVVFSLVQMGLVEEDMIETLSAHFDELDLSGDGFIEQEDLALASQLEREEESDSAAQP